MRHPIFSVTFTGYNNCIEYQDLDGTLNSNTQCAQHMRLNNASERILFEIAAK